MDSSDVADAEIRLERLSRLAKKAHARGDRARYQQFMEAALASLKPPELSDADREAMSRGEVFTDMRGWMAQLVVLKDQGHLPDLKFGDDDESRQFVQDVRRLNRGWNLGQIAKVPTPMGAQQRVVRAAPRPREHAPRSRRARSTSRASRDGPDEPAPARGRPLTPLQTALLPFGVAMELAVELDARALDSFLEVVTIRVARQTAQRWWKAEAP
jgi:hypothetical protein